MYRRNSGATRVLIKYFVYVSDSLSGMRRTSRVPIQRTASGIFLVRLASGWTLHASGTMVCYFNRSLLQRVPRASVQHTYSDAWQQHVRQHVWDANYHQQHCDNDSDRCALRWTVSNLHSTCEHSYLCIDTCYRRGLKYCHPEHWDVYFRRAGRLCPSLCQEFNLLYCITDLQHITQISGSSLVIGLSLGAWIGIGVVIFVGFALVLGGLCYAVLRVFCSRKCAHILYYTVM